jgi:histidine triad (HIT) family protein
MVKRNVRRFYYFQVSFHNEYAQRRPEVETGSSVPKVVVVEDGRTGERVNLGGVRMVESLKPESGDPRRLRMSDCIFCSIIEDKIEGEILHRDDLVTAFRDINPVAPVHLLIVPNKHVASVNELTMDDEQTTGRMLSVARQLAEQENVRDDGFRLIINTGAHGGQEVHHLHMHLIGGQRMRYPMG